MSDRNFLHELIAYLTWAKVGEKLFFSRVRSQMSLSGVQEIGIILILGKLTKFTKIKKVHVMIMSKLHQYM